MTETPDQDRVTPEPDPNSLKTENLRNYTQLRRSTYDRKIAGVAGGLGRHLNIDPVIVRVLLVVLVFFGGAGIILYAAAWLLVPEDNGKPAAVQTSDSTRNTLLIIAAVVAGLSIVGDSWGGFGFPWPLFIIALVVFAVMMSRDNSASPDAPAAPYAAPQPGASYAGEDQPLHHTGQQPGWQPVAPTPPPPYLPPRKQGPVLFGYTLALIAIGLGTLGLYDALATDQVADAAYPALALGITGAMLVVGAFVGRPGGLILVGTIAAVALAATAIVSPRFEGDRSIHAKPTSLAEVQDRYEVPAGTIELDLTQLTEPSGLDGREIHLEATAGEIIVILPEGIQADVDAAIDFGGQIDVGSRTEDGFGRDVRQLIGDGETEVDLHIDLKFGHIEVRQAA